MDGISVRALGIKNTYQRCVGHKGTQASTKILDMEDYQERMNVGQIKGVSFDTIMTLGENLSLSMTLHFRNLSNRFIIMVIQNDFMLQKKQWYQS